jgi:hypothetical protein
MPSQDAATNLVNAMRLSKEKFKSLEQPFPVVWVRRK